MSLITRCPACETLFKVVPDQLRISDGWVRCGQCDEVFDASLHLQQAAPEVSVPAAQQTPSAVTIPEPEASPYVVVQPVDSEPDLGHVGTSDDLPMAFALPDVAGDEDRSVTEVIPPVPPMATRAAYREGPDPDELAFEHQAALSEVSFLRDKSANSFWKKPLMRATLVLLSVVLALGLAGQIAFHERDRMVALQPGLKPWFLAICEPLTCTLSPLRRIEFIVIDSSAFTRIRGDAYRLHFVVKNTATTALAVPAIELTLTDSLDQPVVRRVFLPSELGLKSDALAAGADWPASLSVAVAVAVAAKSETGADRVTGYRLLAFYP